MSYWRKHHRRRTKKYQNEAGCLTTVILIIIAMPLAGLHLLFTGKDSLHRISGIILAVLGAVVWVGLR